MLCRVLLPFHVKAEFFLHLTMLLFRQAVALSRSTNTGTAFAGNEIDHLALMAFKSMISHDPEGVMHSWNNSHHFCHWEGVTCGQLHRRVTFLNLSSRGLVGTLSPYIGNLSFLEKMWLDNNTLEGVIPPEVGHLFSLQDLRLNSNSFGGEIPPSISNCSNLMYFHVHKNKLVGKIPRQLGSLSKLKHLWVHFNNLTGGIPASIGNLTALESLAATYNLLVGTLPHTMGQLKNLNYITLGANYLNGIIPPSIYNLSFLTVLSLPYNQLQGSLPSGIGLMLPQLQNLQLGGNQLTGPLPLTLANASQLVRIDMPLNNFTGKIKTNFGSLQNLQGVSLEINNLGSGESDEMNFLTSLANCSNLQVLELGSNQLGGALPYNVHNFSNQLFYFSLRGNRIYGNIPLWIDNLVGLTQLLLDGNELVGTIPVDVGKLHQLQRFWLNTNNLTGEIPTSIGNLSALNELTLNNNELQGMIPRSFVNCQALILLDLSQNNLSGAIPKEIFGIPTLSRLLNLSRNHLSGSLPQEVGNLKQLSELDVSGNYLSAEIPSSIGSCTSLLSLYMEGNLFQGSISPSWSALRGLQVLDLSHNNFSGQIPKFLEKFSLTNLNLSYNDFEGEIPTEGAFSNASAIDVAGNNRLCGGIVQLQLPRCTINELDKRKISRFHLILIITTLCTILGVMVASIFVLKRLRKMRSVKSSGTLLMEPLLSVSYEMLLKATDGFSSTNLIGVGSSGSVYKGVLEHNQRIVAVKVLNLSHRGVSRSFMAECEALRNIRHRNVVKILTSCSSIDFHGNDFKALVYEFMPNGSIERWLHSGQETGNEQGEPQTLNLQQRINIATDVAHALVYMHNDCERPIIHCDIKPSNILLDEDMVAHVGDFGLARLLLRDLSDANQSTSIGVRGTIGYTPPEYGMGSDVSQKGDVYSYGIFLLETMTGRRPTDPMFDEELNLHQYASTSFPDRVIEILDPILLRDNEDEADAAINSDQRIRAQTSNDTRKECLITMIRLGVACSMESLHDRMDITDAIRELDTVGRILRTRTQTRA